jgi:transcription antitermination factor NusG
MTALRWHALGVATRSEHTAAVHLRGIVDDIFLPTRIERRAWSDRIKRVETPLFPGYAFVRLALTPERRVQLLKVKHVIDVIGRKAGRPDVAPSIPDDEVAGLQRLVATERSLDPLAALVAGKTVVVGAGPLKGVRGVVERGIDGQSRLVVNVTLLGRAVRTVLLADDVVEAPDEPT